MTFSDHRGILPIQLRRGLLRSREVAFLLLTHRPQVWFSAFPKIYLDVAENHRLEESGQRLENVDQTHIVLASGNLVLQKATFISSLIQFCPALSLSKMPCE